LTKKYKTKWFRAALDTYKKDVGWFRTKIEEFYGNRSVNIEDYSARLEEAYNEFDNEGYDVVNVVSISMGESEPSISKQNNYLGDMSFSIDRGAIVVGKLRDNA
tara:strand:+ start:463 stop:774 length:312 start_codon:yes stop_codon:yes gene_type:complete